MNINSIFFAATITFATLFFGEGKAVEISRISIVAKTIHSHYVKRVMVSIDDKVMEIVFPGRGAREKTFAMATDKWRDSPMIYFVLDSRGQTPLIAYFQFDGNDVCFIGQYARLIFDAESNLVIEPLHSSSSEQIVNRYELNKCVLNLHDQLRDKAVISRSTNENSVKRVVTKLKGDNSRKFYCEYSVEQEKTLDPENCFRR